MQDRAELGPVLADLIDGPAGGFLRAAGPALISAGLDVVSAITAPLDTVAPAWAADRPQVTVRPVRRRLARLAVAGAITAVLAIAAPLADAYTGPPYYLAPAPHAASDGRR